MADRRTFLGVLGAGALTACATSGPRARRELLAACSGAGSIARPRLDRDRIIRTLVGLRPFRPQGYVVRRDEVGASRIVHNYGHGGAGITLSWGTAQQAVDLGFAGAGVDHAVIGAGVIGLSTARVLQHRGARVRIYARALPPDTTSNIAGGQWWPTSVFDASVASSAFLQQFHAAVRLAYREFQLLAGPRYGVSWRRNCTLSLEPPQISDHTRSLTDVAPQLRILSPGTHPFGNTWVEQFDSMMVEPSTYLPALIDDFLAAGGRIEVRDFSSLDELSRLPERVVFNCTGLGARHLAQDDALIPVRGQLVILLPQPELDYNLLGRGAYLFPRVDGLVVGGTFQRNDWDTNARAEDTDRILRSAASLMSWAEHCRAATG